MCAYAGCPGDATPNRSHCLIHLDDSARQDYLVEVSQGRLPLVLNGLMLSGRMLAAVFAAMPTTSENPSGQPRPHFPTQVWCSQTIFKELVDAQHVTFAQACIFDKATFQAGVRWNGSAFNGGLNMRGCQIHGNEASFGHVQIRGPASWSGLVCHSLINLFGLTVEGEFDMSDARCGGVWLSNAQLKKAR